MTIFSVLGQEGKSKSGTQINDLSVSGPNVAPLDFSILDLNSNQRGFLMPRMSTYERQNIPKLALQNGLMIYNTSIDCIEFFSQTRDRWLNLCGELDPANIIIQDSKCSEIKVVGNYFQDAFLESRANIILLQVTASTAGTYQIEADSYNNGQANGYSFFASGVFPEPGTYSVVLRGSGTPIKGYDRDLQGKPSSKGDEIRFILNGESVSCVVYNFVEKESLRFKIDRIDQQGKIYTNVDLQDQRSGELIAVIKDFTMGGEAKVYTMDKNGMIFSGSHILSPSEITNNSAKVILKGQGAALIPVETSYDFYTNSYVRQENGESIEYFPGKVKIEVVNVDFNCESSENKITHQGVFAYKQPLTQDNKIVVPVQVLAPGKGQIKGVIEVNGSGFGFQSEKIEFSSGSVDFEFNDATNDIQQVVLTPLPGTGMPTVAGKDMIMDISMESKGANEYDQSYPIQEIFVQGCQYAITPDGLPVIYQIKDIKLNSSFRSISQASRTPYITPKTSMGDQGSEDFKLDVTIEASSPGEYHIKTDEINGIYFEGSGIIEDIDVTNKSKVVSLKAFGRSNIDLPSSEARFTLTTNSTEQQNIVDAIDVDFVYRPMTMYSLGHGAGLGWHIGGITGHLYSGLPNAIRRANHFGWNGVVRIDKLNLIDLPNFESGGISNYGELNNRNTFSNKLGQSDMVFFGSGGSIVSNDVKDLLIDFMKNENGVVVMADSDQANAKYIIDRISSSASTLSFTSSTLTYRNNANRVVSDLSAQNQAILGSENNYFGKEYLPLQNLLLGAHDTTGFLINQLPEDFETIAYLNGSNAGSRNNVYSYVHKKYAFIGINNRYAMGGYTSVNANTGLSTNSNSYPSASRLGTGEPVAVSYAGGHVWNSLFFMNVVHWAIDYAQEHQENKVK
ncbi:hypothetical protein ACYSNM_09400 [Myroides sp. LJL116]